MALDAGVVWEMRTAGNNNSGGGAVWDSLVNSTYRWTASGSGTNEYYVELSGGGDPSLTEPTNVTTDGTYKIDTNGTLGSLNPGEWDWGDNDTLGYSTVYVRLDDGADPDTKNDDFVSMVTGGGTDYSQQDAAQLSLSDLAMTTATTTLTSATGGFTALMIGNIIHITAGTNFTVGWYEITGHTDTNTITLDRDATTGSNGSSGTGAIGGASALPVDAHFEAWTAGNKMYMKSDGVYSPAAVSVAKDGTAAAYMTIEGYDATRGDNPTGANRVTIAAGANSFIFDNYWDIKNIVLTTTHANGFRADTKVRFRNCKSTNSSGPGGRMGFYIQDAGVAIDCEGISTAGKAFNMIGSSFQRLLYCYAHDSVDGIYCTEETLAVISCIIDTCSNYGIFADANMDNYILLHNTIYNCGTGIYITSGVSFIIQNNMITDNTVGIQHNAGEDGTNLVDYNNYDSNTTDVVGIAKGVNATVNAPGFTNAAGGDFSGVDAANGFGVRIGVG